MGGLDNENENENKCVAQAQHPVTVWWPIKRNSLLCERSQRSARAKSDVMAVGTHLLRH